MARMNLNYSETDFRKATFKDIADLIEVQNEIHEGNSNDNEYVEKQVNITDIPFL